MQIMYGCLPVCRSVSLCVSLSVCLYVCLTGSLSVPLSVSVSLCLTVSLSARLALCLSASLCSSMPPSLYLCLPAQLWQRDCLLPCPQVFLSPGLPLCLSLHPSVICLTFVCGGVSVAILLYFFACLRFRSPSPSLSASLIALCSFIRCWLCLNYA